MASYCISNHVFARVQQVSFRESFPHDRVKREVKGHRDVVDVSFKVASSNMSSIMGFHVDQFDLPRSFCSLGSSRRNVVATSLSEDMFIFMLLRRVEIDEE